MVMTSEDIRLRPRFFKSCSTSISRYCDGVPHGKGHLIGCMVRHMHDSDMEPDCRKFLEIEQAKRSTNIAFNPVLNASCASDLESLKRKGLCPAAALSRSRQLPMGENIDCLTSHNDNITDPGCKHAVFNVLVAQSNDIRAKPGMWAACATDVGTLCRRAKHGGGRVHKCLQRHVAGIKNADCKRMVLEVKQLQSKDAFLSSSIRKRCVNEMRRFCPNVEHGQGRLLSCLIDQKDQDGFGMPCRAAILEVGIAIKKTSLDEMTSLSQVVKWLKQQKVSVNRWEDFLVGGAGAVIVIGLCAIGCTAYKQIKKSKSSYTVVVAKDMET